MYSLFKRKKETYQNIDLAAFNILRQQTNTTIIDVRTPKEMASGSIPGHVAFNVSRGDFLKKTSRVWTHQKLILSIVKAECAAPKPAGSCQKWVFTHYTISEEV